jgi:hypothetical protein
MTSQHLKSSGPFTRRSLRLPATCWWPASFPTIGAVTKAAQKARDWQPDFAA